MTLERLALAISCLNKENISSLKRNDKHEEFYILDTVSDETRLILQINIVMPSEKASTSIAPP